MGAPLGTKRPVSAASSTGWGFFNPPVTPLSVRSIDLRDDLEEGDVGQAAPMVLSLEHPMESTHEVLDMELQEMSLAEVQALKAKLRQKK